MIARICFLGFFDRSFKDIEITICKDIKMILRLQYLLCR